jgi:caffeoyl-CoA O-methyltransferase
VAFIVRDEIEEYAARHTTSPTELLAALADETRRTLQSPQMLTGTIEGRFLELLIWGIQARRVLEIGTYSGYSSLSMAAGLPPGGHIDTLEISEEHAEVARRYHAQSQYADRITIHVGPALETLEQLSGPWDFVFIDADKVNYRAYYDAVLPQLAEHGLMAIDNTLWSGRVAEDGDDDSPETRALKALNDDIAADPRVAAVMLTVRDGITLVRRIE